MRSILFTLLALFAFALLQASEVTEKPLVVHEWGTFTSLQNENGESVGGVNNEEELLPRFVHTLGWEIQHQNRRVSETFKGMARCRPDITMRLETPVVYFHLPDGVKETRVDLNLKFNGGYLTQYFPIAQTVPADEKGLEAAITDATQGSLTWKNLQVGSAQTPPVTESEIWNAPRRVKASVVEATPATCDLNEYDQSENKAVVRQIPQVEQYLFYRGVGQIDAPLRISRNEGKFSVSPSSSVTKNAAGKYGALPSKLWLVDIAEDGSVAWSKHDLKEPVIEKIDDKNVRELPMAEFSGDFNPYAYQDGNREKLKLELKEALIQDGMFNDEADALLNTWEASYFKAPGMRAFFMVPQEWTDRVLPMTIKSELSVAPVKRAMVARVELITPEQRELVGKIVTSGNRFYAPDVQKLYLKLGRFRNVILMDAKNKLNEIINHF